MSEATEKFKDKVFIAFFFILFLPFLLISLVLFLPFLFLDSLLEFFIYRKVRLMGANTIFCPSGVKSFDSQVENCIEELEGLKLFKIEELGPIWRMIFKRRGPYSNDRAAIYIKENELIIYFQMTAAVRKFKGENSTKLDNILRKLREYNRRKMIGNPIKNQSELNLHYDKDGFGHIQHQSERIDRWESSSGLKRSDFKGVFALKNNRFFYIFVLFFLLMLISGPIASYFKTSAEDTPSDKIQRVEDFLRGN